MLAERFCVFPNDAVTGVLVLAQSHLSIHTWPELSLANVDLLSYGDVRARRGDARDLRAARCRPRRPDLHPSCRRLTQQIVADVARRGRARRG